MDITTGAMASLIPKLGELLMEESKLPKGLRQEIQHLSREMMSSQAALRKLGEVPLYQQDPGARIWAVKVRELSYDLEDRVDSFLMGLEGSKPANLKVRRTRVNRLMQKVSILFDEGKQRHEVADAIKNIKDRVIQTADRNSIDDVVRFPAVQPTDPRLMALYQDRKYIIGIEGSSEDLIKKIICPEDYSSKRPLKILSIFGCMGLGKTTLAKVVYDQLKEEFSCRAFVSVGPNPDLRRVLKDLLIEVGAGMPKDFSSLDKRELLQALMPLLEKKRYLIVVDDIWDTQTWEFIKIALGDHACGSSVIITTRNFAVAQTAGEVYKLKPLSHAKSEELFYKRLVGGKDKIPDELAEITKSVIKKCDCIPLAIITMASLLVDKPLQEWSQVYNSIGFGHSDDRDLENTRNISLISYYDLPSRLRTCLVHLTIFPEGYMIRKDTLIWKWIAQGFVSEERGLGLFVVGENCFNELINRSLVEPVEIPHSGIIIGCRVNVMVLDMICLLSREENFVTIIDSHNQNTSKMHQARLIAIQNSVVNKGLEENDMLANQYVRSFNASKCEFQMMPSLASFKLVRVLALEDCASIGGIYHLELIKELVLLRYLGLLNTPICELPEGIEELAFLETLDLRQTKIEKLPHGIVLLRRLMCMRTGSRSITVPDGMGNLASLEELQLSDVAASPNIVKELGKLKRLRDLKLCIRLSNERVERDLVYSLGDLQKIEILHVDGGLWIDESCWQGYVPSIYLRHVFLGMKFSRLPAWINPVLLPMLSHLSVDVSVVEEKDLVNLGSLPNLLSLSLVGDYVSLPDIMRGDAFPRLKYCYTSRMVRFLKGAAPDLESISFNVQMWGSKDGRFDLNFSSLLDHSQLQEVRVEIFCTEAHVAEVEAVEAALRNVVDRHLIRPTLAIRKWISSVSEQYGSHYDVDGNEYYDDYEIDSDHEYYDDVEE